MSANASISDTSRGEVLRYSGEVRFGYGANSPYPTDSQAPVPEASFAVAEDADNLYRMDNTARIDYQREGVSGREMVFGGRFATSSDAPIGTMNITHASALLNKEIRTLPILPQEDPALDRSNGRKIIAGTLRHWYSECGLTEWGVRGDFMFSTSNSVPSVAYYDHPTMRMTGRYQPSNNLVRWHRTEPYSADPGMSFGVGESFTWVVKANEQYGRGGITPDRDAWASYLDMTSGKPDPAFDEGVNVKVRMSLVYDYDTNRLRLGIRNSATDTEVDAIQVNLGDIFPGAPAYVAIVATRVSTTQVQFAMEFFYLQGGTTYYTWVSDADIFPSSIALETVWGTLVDNDYSSPSLYKEGVQGIYVIKGDQFTIQEEDEWQINLPWFNKPKFRDIVVPGMNGNAWSMIHDLCSAYGLKFAPIFNSYSSYENVGYSSAWPTHEGSNIVVQASARELSETVEVINYNYDSGTVDGFYKPIYKADQVFSLALGETQEHVIQLEEGSSYQSIAQPQIYSVSTVIGLWNDPENQYSAYSVYDDDNLEVDPNSWKDGGGYIAVEPTENVSEIKIIIQAPNNDLISKESNFHISIAGSDIPSLIITASGVQANKETITSKTGAGKARNLQKLGTTYDNQLVCNSKIAWDMVAGLASLHGTTQTRATGSYPPPSTYDFSSVPVLKRGSYYVPLSVSHWEGALNISDSVRFNPVGWIKGEYSNMSCGKYEELWQGTVCRENNISPMGTEHF